jgi:molybdate transport system substrate-binding protein
VAAATERDPARQAPDCRQISNGLDELYITGYSNRMLDRLLRRFARPIALLLSLAMLSSCGTGTAPQQGPVVLAASSLQEALEEAADAWAATGHAPAVLSFAATSALARQVEQGAPADLFFSADEEWADALEAQGLLREGTRRDLLANRLVLIRATGGEVRGLEELGEGRLALADPRAVPAGRYARAALESLGQWQQVAPKVVPAENVRAALALVERGEAELGIVYATDARASGGVEVIATVPESSHPPIRYPVAVLTASKHPDAAAFAEFLASAEASAIFQRHGFGLAR